MSHKMTENEAKDYFKKEENKKQKTNSSSVGSKKAKKYPVVQLVQFAVLSIHFVHCSSESSSRRRKLVDDDDIPPPPVGFTCSCPGQVVG
ncbi:hypothetical protein T07_2699 [Trichinella nelsoni]|uniref:Uncharacterized protein n=1 Tax=Trichinella nelsoni TaxID=6336 RepID=A0A0V0RSA8_9BILA|nr:hypothetical protein T07_2699 [Trichinella nelsoni]